MAIKGLNHFNITAPPELLAQVRDFYTDVLGLEEGSRPDFGVPGYWLYAGSSALVHLLEGDIGGAADNTGQLDHIAFTCDGLDATESRFRTLRIKYKKSEFPDSGLTQLFVHDPVGLGVEMNFAS